MRFIRKQVLSGQPMFGIGASLGSSIITELIGRNGYDWVWIDLEHGSGGMSQLIPQIQAIEPTKAVPIVRVPWNEPYLFKRVLDAGAAGIMVPFVSSATEAQQVVSAMRYPPDGCRGVAKFTRACGFGQGFDEYYAHANEELLTVVQLETPRSIENADAIAAVDGVDVLFIGPLDLSVAMGHPQEYSHPDFIAAMDTVIQACKRHGKVPGILVPLPGLLGPWLESGFRFLVVGSDGGLLASGLKSTLEACKVASERLG